MTVRRLLLALPMNADAAIEPLRDAVMGVIRIAFAGLSTRDPIVVAAGELVENAARFGRWQGGKFPFELEIEGGPVEFVIRASNPVRPGEANLTRLAETLETLRRSPSAREAYLDRMRQAALARGPGGLGLTRVAHECGCEMSFDCTPEGKLTVQAVARGRLVTPIPVPPA